MTEVRIKRTELPAPTIDDKDRKVVQVQYQVGELPPRFLYIPKAEWTKEREAGDVAKAIKALAETKEEIIEIPTEE